MAISEIINKLNDMVGDMPDYVPYNIRNVIVEYGIPPVTLKGIDYVLAKYNQPQNKLFMGLNGKGVFAANKNKSGIIEIGLLDSCRAVGIIQAFELTGIPYPLVVVDTTTGGLSTVVATACKRVGTPEWRKELMAGIEIFTFETPSLIIMNGVRLTT